MGKRSTIYCSAVNCSNNRLANPDLSFHRFPLDLLRCREWVQNCQRLDLLSRTPEYLSKNCYICSSHFESEFLPKFSNRRKRLNRNAKPTLFNVMKISSVISCCEETQSSSQKGRLKVKKIKLIVKALLSDHSYAKQE